MRKGIIFADTHLSVKEPFHPSYLLVKKFAKDFKPDFVADLGDSLDLEYFASFNKEKVSSVDGDWEGDVDLLNGELDWWQGITKDYYWMQGNHDERAERMAVAINTAAMRTSLNYERRFHIKERGIKWKRLVDQPGKVGKLHLIHGWFYNIYHAKKTLEYLSGNVIYGHVHTRQTHSKHLTAFNQQIQGESIGCLCDKQPDYKKGVPSGWMNTFAVVYMDDKGNYNLYHINIIKDSFIWEGREWRMDS